MGKICHQRQVADSIPFDPILISGNRTEKSLRPHNKRLIVFKNLNINNRQSLIWGVFVVLTYLGIQSKIVIQQLKSCINRFYGCFSLKIIFRNTSPNKSFPFIRTDSAVPLCQGLCIRLVIGIVIPFTLEKQSAGSMTEKRSTNHASAIADHMALTGHRIKWDHFDILATGRSDEHCKI